MMRRKYQRINFKPCFLILSLTLFVTILSGCEDNKGKSALLAPSETVKKSEKTLNLHGMVSTDKGSVTNAKIEARDKSGNIVATSQLADTDRYSLEIPAGTVFPVELKAYPASGQSSTEALISVVMDPLVSSYNIDSSTTAIAKKAKSLGGYTPANMMHAAMSGISIPDANKTTSGFRGDPTKQYGGWH